MTIFPNTLTSAVTQPYDKTLTIKRKTNVRELIPAGVHILPFSATRSTGNAWQARFWCNLASQIWDARRDDEEGAALEHVGRKDTG